jgi:hypothetical protein
MSPLTIVLFIVIISAVTLANFVLWLRFRAKSPELENQRPIDGLKQ